MTHLFGRLQASIKSENNTYRQQNVIESQSIFVIFIRSTSFVKFQIWNELISRADATCHLLCHATPELSNFLRENYPWAIKKDRNSLWATRKVQRSSAPLLQLFFALHATAVRLGSNGVKLQVWKVKNTFKSKYVINFFEHLNDFKWKNSKL